MLVPDPTITGFSAMSAAYKSPLLSSIAATTPIGSYVIGIHFVLSSGYNVTKNTPTKIKLTSVNLGANMSQSEFCCSHHWAHSRHWLEILP